MGALLLIAVGLALDLGLSSSSLERDLSRTLFGDDCGVNCRGDRERCLGGVCIGIDSGDLSLIRVSLGSPRLDITEGCAGGSGGGPTGIGLCGSPYGT